MTDKAETFKKLLNEANMSTYLHRFDLSRDEVIELVEAWQSQQAQGATAHLETLAKIAESEDISVEVVYDDHDGSPTRFEQDISEHVAKWIRGMIGVFTMPGKPAPAAVPEDQLREVIRRLKAFIIINHGADVDVLTKRVNPLLRDVAPAPAEPAAVPGDWKLVPAVPSQKMLDAGYWPCTQGRGAKSVWASMIDAAPAEPESDLEADDLHYAMRLLQKMNGTFGLGTPNDDDRDWFAESLRLVEHYKRKLGVGPCEMLPAAPPEPSRDEQKAALLEENERLAICLEEALSRWEPKSPGDGSAYEGCQMALNDHKQAALFRAHNGAED